MEPVLKPLVYQEPLELVAAPPRARRAGLHRLGDAAGDRRGARATSSASTARSARPARSWTASTPAARSAALHGEGKAAALRELAGASTASTSTASTAYSDSHTDLPFLEAVGNPVAVNPDRELRRIAEERGWPVLEFGELAYPPVRRLRPALLGIPLVLGAGAAVWAARRRAA